MHGGHWIEHDRHVTFQTALHELCMVQVKGEEEYLFTAYSVFTVIKPPRWGAKPTDWHEIHLQAALDNKLEDEDLPLAPWS